MKSELMYSFILSVFLLASCHSIGLDSLNSNTPSKVDVSDMETVPSPDNQITVEKLTTLSGEDSSSVLVGAYNVRPETANNVKVMSLDSMDSKILTENLVCKDEKNRLVRFAMSSVSQNIPTGEASAYRVMLKNEFDVEKGSYACQFVIVENNLYVLAKTTAFIEVE